MDASPQHRDAFVVWTTRLSIAIVMIVAHGIALAAQTRSDGAIAGVIVGADEIAVADAIVELVGGTLPAPRTVRSDSLGRFRIGALSPGLYDIAVRRLGFQSATLTGLRVATARTTDVRVTLTQSATRLSTVTIVSSMTSVDVTTPSQVERFEAADIALLPTGRDAASLVALVPGARVGAVWGGGGELSNNIQLDGVSVGHPGIGGDFLRPSVDWIERLEVRGLGAGADHGNFQGGVINAVTRSGTDRRFASLRTNLEAASLSETNFNVREEGVEQSGRRELSGEAGGPIIPGRLHYFLGGQTVARELRVPDLTSSNDFLGFRSVETELRETRGFGKLTWRPDAAGRLDLIVGGGQITTERAGLTGVDDPTATQQVRAPTLFYEVAWNWDRGARHAFDVKLVGFTATEERIGYAGADVPGVRAFAIAREPGFQNADFRERLDPSSLTMKATWTSNFGSFGVRHRLMSGVEVGGGRWHQELIRNAGLTWRPFPDPAVGVINPSDPMTWAASGSQWGGEIRLRSEVRNAAVFLQDEITLGPRVTLSPGLRLGAWEGVLRARSGLDPSVRATGVDPRLGIAWDVLGDGSTALKAHWGRYHQGMAASLFDRLAGAEVYSNERFYVSGPRPPTSSTVYAPAQRDSLFLDVQGQPLGWNEKRFDESGRADGYRQPYMDQYVLAAERAFGPRWKVELVYTDRRNRNLVGLVDRNLASNHTPIRDVVVRTRYGTTLVNPEGEVLRLPVVWLANNDLRAALEWMRGALMPPPPGFSYDTIPTLTWNQDLAVSTLPDARRTFRQAYVAVRTEQDTWSAAGSFAWTELQGNVQGVTGFEGSRDAFRAGAWARPNEGVNNFGPLDGFAELEAKVWVNMRLPGNHQGGFTVTHLTGERITPFFEMEAFRYRFSDADIFGPAYLSDLFNGQNGQTIFLEPRGRRRYADRTIVDLRLERVFRLRSQSLLVTLELFNVFAEDEITAVKLRVDDDFLHDPTTAYAAPRVRVSPRRLRIGTRIEF